jgi:hypothetical protein
MSMAGAISPHSLAVGGPFADFFGVRTLYFIAGGALLIPSVIGLRSIIILNLEGQAKSKISLGN